MRAPRYVVRTASFYPRGYLCQQEQEQLKALRDAAQTKSTSDPAKSEMDRDFEGGFGGQEDLEDRYATTLGEH